MSEQVSRRAVTEEEGPGRASTRVEHRMRTWIIGASIGMLLLALAGLFILILLDVPSELVALWLTALSTVSAVTLAAINSKRSGPDADPPQ